MNVALVGAVIRSVTGTVTKVSDGDTIQIATQELAKLKVRLYGIDAPLNTLPPYKGQAKVD